MSIERSMKQFEDDRIESVKLAARLLLASGTTAPRVGGVGECTIQILDDPRDIEDLCQAMEDMATESKAWGKIFPREAAILRDADAVLIITSLRSVTDPADINCNMCGKLTCEYLREAERIPPGEGVAYAGPLCIFRANNVAYAIDGVVSQARNLGIDYGVYWSAGAAAMRMGIPAFLLNPDAVPGQANVRVGHKQAIHGIFAMSEVTRLTILPEGCSL